MIVESGGVVIGVRVRDERFFVVRGVASIEQKRPLSSQSAFMVGSLAKQFVGASTMEAYNRNLIDFSTPITQIVSKCRLSDVTLNDLLNHTSGIRETEILFALAGLREHDYVSAIDHVEALQIQTIPMFVPGSDFSYSNINYVLVTEILEKICQSSLKDICYDFILNKSGLKHTNFMSCPDDVIINRADSYRKTVNGNIVRMLRSPPIVGPSGLWSTADDLLHWSENRLNLLKYAPAITINGSQAGAFCGVSTLDAAKYQCGLVNGYNNGHFCVGHAGDDQGYSSQLLTFNTDISLVVLCNNADFRAADIAADIWYRAIQNNLLMDISISAWKDITESSLATTYNSMQSYKDECDIGTLSNEEEKNMTGRYISSSALAPIIIEIVEGLVYLRRGSHNDLLKRGIIGDWIGPGYNLKWDGVDHLFISSKRSGVITFKKEINAWSN